MRGARKMNWDTSPQDAQKAHGPSARKARSPMDQGWIRRIFGK